MQIVKLVGLPDKELVSGPMDAEEIIGPLVKQRAALKFAARHKHLSDLELMCLSTEAPDVQQAEADAIAARSEVRELPAEHVLCGRVGWGLSAEMVSAGETSGARA